MNDEMDMAADAAKQELIALLEKETDPAVRKGVQLIVAWLKKHYMKAGYKRLCKVFLEAAK